jgi:hypothetical protein
VNAEKQRRYRVLHVADPHFGNCHFVGNPSETGSRHAEELIDLLKRHKLLSPKFDAMVLSGDFTFACEPGGFESAERFIDLLAPHIERGGIVVIPGNHDIDLSTPVVVGQLSLPTPKWEAERQFRQFLSRIAKHVGTPNHSLSMITRIPCANGPALVIVGLNSCRVERRDAQGWGYVGTDQIYEVGHKLLGPGGARDGDLIVAVTHHNLLPIWDLGVQTLGNVPERRKFSFTMDAGGTLGFLADLGVSVLLHGHTHVQSVKRVDGYGFGADRQATLTLILGSGSLGITAGRNDEPHHFQVIELEDSELFYWDLSCSVHQRNEPRNWVVSPKPHRASLFAYWDSSRAESVLERKRRESHTCQYDFDVMQSWSVLGPWKSAPATRHEAASRLLPVVQAGGAPWATTECLERVMDEITSNPPSEFELCNWTLAQYLADRIKKAAQSWSLLSKWQSEPKTKEGVVTELLAAVLRVKPSATADQIEKTIRDIVLNPPLPNETCGLTLEGYIAARLKTENPG